jgi:hypothetical protein
MSDLPTSNYSIEALELFRLFPGADFREKFKLSTAVRMSASFPFFSPSVSLPTNPRRRVIDAGFYDNYGVSLSATWLCSGNNLGWIREHTDRICLIQIHDGEYNVARRLEKVPPESSNLFTRTVEEFLSPLEGLDNARVASSSFRNDGQLEMVSRYFGLASTPENPIKFTVVNFEYSGPACMNWRLTKKELEDLKNKAKSENNIKKIRLLLEYLFSEEKAPAEK